MLNYTITTVHAVIALQMLESICLTASFLNFQNGRRTSQFPIPYDQKFKYTKIIY